MTSSSIPVSFALVVKKVKTHARVTVADQWCARGADPGNWWAWLVGVSGAVNLEYPGYTSELRTTWTGSDR